MALNENFQTAVDQLIVKTQKTTEAKSGAKKVAPKKPVAGKSPAEAKAGRAPVRALPKPIPRSTRSSQKSGGQSPSRGSLLVICVAAVLLIGVVIHFVL
jgi:hypothetical protein